MHTKKFWIPTLLLFAFATLLLADHHASKVIPSPEIEVVKLEEQSWYSG